MFEEYGFEGVYVAIQAVLTLYAQGESFRSIFMQMSLSRKILTICESLPLQ